MTKKLILLSPSPAQAPFYSHSTFRSRRSITVAFSLLLLLALMLMACSPLPIVAPAEKDVVSLDANAWYVMYGQQMPAHPSPTPDGAWSLSLPQSSGSIGYVETPFWPSVPPHNKVSITFRLSSSPDAVYNGRVDPEAWDPATFHLFLERYGDDMCKEYYRWWAANGVYILGSKDNSTVTIEIPLTADNWTSVHGYHDESEFQNALKDLGWVGITFGGSNYFGHGVNMSSGTSTFTLIDYHVD